MTRRTLELVSPIWLLLALSACGGGSETAPGFTLSVGTPASIVAGGTGTLAVSAQRTPGHAAAIALSLAANGDGIVGSGSISAGTDTGTLTITVPVTAAATTHTLSVIGSDGVTSSQTAVALPVAAALAISTGSPLAVGAAANAYALNLATTGANGAVAWSVGAGSLPPGLTLASSGLLSGTCASAGTYSFTLQATDAANVVVTKPVTMLVTGALVASLGTNGSFESGFTTWSQLGSGSGVSYAIVTDAVQGTSAARVTNRGQLTHAPGQNVFSSTLANANGTPMTTRFSVKLDAPGMARCSIKLTATANSQSTTTSVILAEQVVRTASTWTLVSGTATLAWTGTLTAAVLEFSIGQPAEGVFQDFTLDDVRLQRDADRDGLCDVDEGAETMHNPDRDNDGLPDGWESSHLRPGLLDPDVADAVADADADGFQNRQEYWAATDPLDANSRPGVPCVSGANAAVQAIDRGLALLPCGASARVMCGQHITGDPAQGGVPGEFTTNVQALFDQTGKWPGLLSLQYEGLSSAVGPLQIAAVNAVATSWAATGGLVLIKYQPFDPWTLAASSPSGQPHVDLPGLLDPALGDPTKLAANTTANATYLGWLDQVATGLDELQQAGIVVLWRPYSEMNNGSHWHSRQPRDAWIAVWRHMFAYLSTTRGLKNLIWVYESDSVAHLLVPADYYYPGDDFVDFMGHNLYDDDWVLPYDLEGVFRRYPKIYGIPQAGSATVRDGTWDNRYMIEGIRAGLQRVSLFCTWNDFYTSGNVFNARSMVGQSFAAELLADPWVMTRDEIGW